MGWAKRPTRTVMAEEKDCLEELQRIGLRISYFRRVKGMTQADLAESVHINKNYLSHIECGVGKAISLPLLIRIAKALGIKLSVLVDLDDWTTDADKNSEAVAIQELRQMMNEMCQMNSELDRMMQQMDDLEGESDYDVEDMEDSDEGDGIEDSLPSQGEENVHKAENTPSVTDIPKWMKKK